MFYSVVNTIVRHPYAFRNAYDLQLVTTVAPCVLKILNEVVFFIRGNVYSTMNVKRQVTNTQRINMTEEYN